MSTSSPDPPAAGATDLAADRDELTDRAEGSERVTSQTTSDMSDVQQTDNGSRKRKSPPSPPVDSSSADSSLPSRRSEAESVAIAAATSYWQPAGWSEMTADFIECIASFLPLKSLPMASAVCRGWLSGIDAMSARDDQLQLHSGRLLRFLTSSARRHITSLTVSHDAPFAPISTETLFLLQFAMPHLTRLVCIIEWLVGPGDRPLRPPMHLTQLDVILYMDLAPGVLSLTAAMVWSHLERVLGDVAQVRTLTRLIVQVSIEKEVSSRLGTTPIPPSTLPPLARLRDTLMSLWLLVHDPELQPLEPLTRDHIDFIRSMHCVTDLCLVGLTRWAPPELERLTAEPMTMQLRYLDLRFGAIVEAHTAALALLTSLTMFSSHRLDLHNPSFLAQMTRLVEVELLCTSRVDPALLVVALSNCSRIEHLCLQHGGMTDAHLGTLMPPLTHLSCLKFGKMTSLTSLSFASTVPHLSRTLHDLAIFKCQALPLTDLRHLRALTALRKITCHDSFTELLDSHTRACMTPSSECFVRSWWPHLTEFDFKSRG